MDKIPFNFPTKPSKDPSILPHFLPISYHVSLPSSTVSLVFTSCIEKHTDKEIRRSNSQEMKWVNMESRKKGLKEKPEILKFWATLRHDQG